MRAGRKALCELTKFRKLSELQSLRVEATGDDISVWVPDINDTARLHARNIEICRAVLSPTGELAMQLLVVDSPREATVIFINSDVVFSPVSAGGLLDSPVSFTVDDAPDMVAYSEMERDAREIVRACEQLDDLDLDQLAGALLLLRCSILGAAQVGLRPSRAAALWHQSWRAVEGDLPLPRFHPDADWDQLLTIE